MQNIEPNFNWRKYYSASVDLNSPFFGRKYSEFECRNTIYNYYIHPQWDEFGSETLYLKIIFANYQLGVAYLEFIGEWNDTLYNDIMYLKREVIDLLILHGITKFILIGENILNFHSSDDSYYEEWFNDIEQGWIVAINFHPHVIEEFISANIDTYIMFDNQLNTIHWRTQNPIKLFQIINNQILKKLGP